MGGLPLSGSHRSWTSPLPQRSSKQPGGHVIVLLTNGRDFLDGGRQIADVPVWDPFAGLNSQPLTVVEAMHSGEDGRPVLGHPWHADYSSWFMAVQVAAKSRSNPGGGSQSPMLPPLIGAACANGFAIIVIATNMPISTMPNVNFHGDILDVGWRL